MIYKSRKEAMTAGFHKTPQRGICTENGKVVSIAISKVFYPDVEQADGSILYIAEGGFDRTGVQIADQQFNSYNGAFTENLKTGDLIRVLLKVAEHDFRGLENLYRVTSVEVPVIEGFKRIQIRLRPSGKIENRAIFSVDTAPCALPQRA